MHTAPITQLSLLTAWCGEKTHENVEKNKTVARISCVPMDAHLSSGDVFGKADFDSLFNSGPQMKVGSSSNQQNAFDQFVTAQRSEQAAQPPAQPAVFDTSGSSGTQRSASSNDGSTQDPMQIHNVGTNWKLGPNGEHIYLGSFPAPQPQRDPNHAETQTDVFKRGFKDGATHPAQTMGKINDMATGDKSHSGEETGKKIDDVLQKLPVIGDALTITRGAAGEKDPDGNPQLPQPNVQLEVPGDSVKGGQLGRPAEKPSSEVPSNTKPGTEPAPSESPSAGSGSAPVAPVPSKPAQSGTPQSRTDEPPANTPQADEPAKNAPSASGSHFDVPAQYAGKPKGNLEADPHTPGVFRDDKGQSYIQAGEQNWPVRYDKDNGTWRVYQPDDPAKLQYPIALDEQGNWQVHDDVGLKGGSPSATASSSDNMANRDRLHDTATNSPTGNVPGSYPSSVKIVNDMLKRLDINLSDQSADAIVNNLHQVNAGEIAHASASAREVWTFARDVADPNLPMKDRAAAAFGMVLNGVLAPAYMTGFDLNNYHFGRDQSADLRRAMQMFVQFDPHA
ncbi:hypothetical protein PQR71_38175 [Paraburkholderia fungorum]|uniref:hypothetical protein n=1 Tax=Paraburkholderia fungorum TaxID=134537 RepID=UPI0038BBFDBB